MLIIKSPFLGGIMDIALIEKGRDYQPDETGFPVYIIHWPMTTWAPGPVCVNSVYRDVQSWAMLMLPSEEIYPLDTEPETL